MRVLLIFTLFSMLGIVGNFSNAQTFEINPFSGYTFPSTFDITGGTAKLEGNANFGISFGYITPNDVTEFEFSYTYFGTNANASSVYLVEEENSRARLHFVMAGVNRLLTVSEKVTFFGGVKLGASNLAFPDGENQSSTKFTVGVQAGMRYYLSDRIGFRMQGNLLMPIVSEGGSLWWSPSSGTGISGWSPIVPFSLNGGLIIRIYK
ncbi:hypothetical protein [Shivajiella indica]|uniref:Outer membrane protein beta-barrel domain-containing protein n=1 Tax=Shivajiella indica TaxID=872115 RepID=A0ABW5BEW3_9BACT